MTVVDLGTIHLFSSPAAGQPFSTTVPANKAWKLWAGSCLLTTNATVANRNPFLTCTLASGNAFLWAGGLTSLTLGSVPDFSVVASSAMTLVFHEQQAELNDIYNNTYMPIPIKAIWLLSGAVINIKVQNIQTGDQLSNIGFLIEEQAT